MANNIYKKVHFTLKNISVLYGFLFFCKVTFINKLSIPLLAPFGHVVK